MTRNPVASGLFPTWRSSGDWQTKGANRASTSRDVTIEVDLSTPSSRSKDGGATSGVGTSSTAGSPDQGTNKRTSKITVSPLTAEAITAPDGCSIEFSHIINTGEGLVWTIDWSPVNMTDESSLLAIGCHPPGSSDALHELTELCTKKDAVIQVWKVKGAAKEGKIEPLVNIVHDGGVTWSACWCPSPHAAHGRLGLLAAVLGDGSVCVWDVPELFTPMGEGQGGITCRVAPIAELATNHVDGSIPCTVDWLPYAPYDLLLVGYRDGCVSIVQLVDGNSPETRLFVKQYFPAEVLTLTSARWLPAELHGGNVGIDAGAERRTFVTCGHESALNIWDTRMEYVPRLSIKTNCAYTIQDMTFTTTPLGISVAMEDASVRGVLMGAHEIDAQLKSGRPPSLLTYKGLLRGSLWAIDAGAPSIFSKGSQQSIAYGGEDGIVGIMGNASYPYLAKKRKEEDIPLLVLEVSEDSESTFKLSSGDKVPTGILYNPKKDAIAAAKEARDKDVIPNAAHTIYSLRWSKPSSGQGVGLSEGQWLAYGNASGIVHVVWVKCHGTGQ